MVVNPSWLIASSLPPYLPSTPTCPTRIKVLIYPSPIQVAWRTVMDLIPRMYPPFETSTSDPSMTTPDPVKLPFDMVVHMGISSRRAYYSVETHGHRDGYNKYEDVLGETLPASFGKTLWPDCPEIMYTSFDYQDVLRRWKQNLLPLHSTDAEEVDVRLSDDAGHFMCDFIYFSSLSQYYRRNGRREDGERPVLFLHIPAGSEEEDIIRGQETTVALIRAMAESRRAAKQ